MILEPKTTTVAYRCPECGAGVLSAVGMFALSADRIKLRCSNPECPTRTGKTDGAAAGADTDTGAKTRVDAKTDDENSEGEKVHVHVRDNNRELDIVYLKDGDGRVRLTVPCIFCGKPHTFTVNSGIFFGRDLFTIPCPYSGINICFMGGQNHVRAELARSELEMLDMLEENGLGSFRDLAADEEALPDPQIFDIIMFVIHDLEAEGKIYCRCNDGEHVAESDDSVTNDAVGDDAVGDDASGDYGAEMTHDGIRVFCRKCGAERIIPTDSLLGAHDFLNCDSLHLTSAASPRGE